MDDHKAAAPCHWMTIGKGATVYSFDSCQPVLSIAGSYSLQDLMLIVLPMMKTALRQMAGGLDPSLMLTWIAPTVWRQFQSFAKANQQQAFIHLSKQILKLSLNTITSHHEPLWIV